MTYQSVGGMANASASWAYQRANAKVTELIGKGVLEPSLRDVAFGRLVKASLEAEKLAVPKHILEKAAKELPANVASRLGAGSAAQAAKASATQSVTSGAKSTLAAAGRTGIANTAKSTLRSAAPIAVVVTALECGWAQVKFAQGKFDKEQRNKAFAVSAISNSAAVIGAAAGAAIGSVVPILGTAIGSFIGGVLGGIAGAAAADSALS